MLRCRSIAAGLGLLAVIALGAAQSASADYMFDLITGNPGLAGFTGPFAQVDVHLSSSTTATITFTSLTNSGNIYLLGDGGSVDVNVNATSFTLGTITGSNSGTGFTPGPWSSGGSGTVDGFAVFNQTIDSFDGFSHSSDMISFGLTDTSGTWSSATDVLTPNSDGEIAAAHIFVTSSPANASNGALATGYASGVIPEPSSLILFGLGVTALAFVMRRRFVADGADRFAA